jgi:hypothetical protein
MRIDVTTLLILPLAIAAAATDDTDHSLGTWKLNAGKSQYSPGPLPYKSLMMTRTATAGGVRTTITAQRLDGTPMNISYTARYGGLPYSIPGTGHPNDTISTRQIDASTFTTERWKPGGKYHVAAQFVVSTDRKAMIQTLSGTDADGKATKARIVYDRQ